MTYVQQIFPYELYFETARSRGPGGQNVNKTNSAVILRWNVSETASFSDEQKERLLKKLSAVITNTGDLLIRSEEFRYQVANRQRCLEKLEKMLQKVFFKPKTRVKTKPTRSAVEKRHEEKRRHSRTKKLRQKVNLD